MNSKVESMIKQVVLGRDPREVISETPIADVLKSMKDSFGVYISKKGKGYSASLDGDEADELAAKLKKAGYKLSKHNKKTTKQYGEEEDWTFSKVVKGVGVELFVHYSETGDSYVLIDTK